MQADAWTSSKDVWQQPASNFNISKGQDGFRLALFPFFHLFHAVIADM